MKTFLRHTSVLLLLIVGFCACTGNKSRTDEGTPIALSHATLLHMERTDSFTLVTVKDPWHEGKTLATYILVDRTSAMPHHIPEGTVVRTPIEHAALTTSVHVALLAELGVQNSIAGITDAEFVVSQQVKSLLSTQGGHIRPMGSSMQPNAELIRAAHCDAVFISPFENAGSGPLERLGLPIIACADYMETSPLGRAEWMRFYGMLFGCSERADSLFSQIKTDYETLAAKIKDCRERKPTVICDRQTGATWYQPGGASTMGQMLADAGAQYVWAERKEAGSLPLDMESVFARGRNADIWIIKYGADTPLSYPALANDNPRYCNFSAWKERHIWTCNTLLTPFYEETPFHPERLLQNLAGIFHPSLVPPSLRHTYYKPMEGK